MSTAPGIDPTEQDLEILHQVDQGRVGYSRGRYYLRATGQPDLSAAVQRLRALQLVVLAREPAGKIPPTRRCELTGLGEQVLTASEAPG